MERINLVIDPSASLITIDKNGAYFLDEKGISSSLKVIVKEGVVSDLLIKEINRNCDIEFDVKKDASLIIKGLINGDSLNINILSKNDENSLISMHFIDFSTGKSTIFVNGEMKKTGTSYCWQTASLAANNDDKIIKVNLEHNNLNQYGEVSNYGVCKDGSKLEIAGTTHIENGAKNTNTKQNAKIMLIDEFSRGIAKPILKIDENDVKANHGASLGQLNEEHLFYLTSRGLSEAEAKRLIILGYFNQIVVLFKEEEIEEYILKLIEERV